MNLNLLIFLFLSLLAIFLLLFVKYFKYFLNLVKKVLEEHQSRIDSLENQLKILREKWKR